MCSGEQYVRLGVHRVVRRRAQAGGHQARNTCSVPRAPYAHAAAQRTCRPNTLRLPRKRADRVLVTESRSGTQASEPARRHMEGTWHAVDDVLVRPSDQARNTRMFLVAPSLLLRLMASWLINEFRQHQFLYARARGYIDRHGHDANE
jgi:hypothetical protein